MNSADGRRAEAASDPLPPRESDPSERASPRRIPPARCGAPSNAAGRRASGTHRGDKQRAACGFVECPPTSFRAPRSAVESAAPLARRTVPFGVRRRRAASRRCGPRRRAPGAGARRRSHEARDPRRTRRRLRGPACGALAARRLSSREAGLPHFDPRASGTCAGPTHSAAPSARAEVHPCPTTRRGTRRGPGATGRAGAGLFEAGLGRGPANHAALTPLDFIARAAAVHPEAPALVHGSVRRTWGETYARARRLASALAARGVGRGDTVAVMAPNVPALFEAHFGVPMASAVLGAINTRLDAGTVAYILDHGEAKVVMVDVESAELMREALARTGRDILVVDIADEGIAGEPVGELDYEALLAEGDPDHVWSGPEDEWDAIALNYTSGTTAAPKGVVYHHRGAALNAISNVVTWSMPRHPVYLWTLPMFHCNGWCFPWTLALQAGTSVCLRAVRAEPILRAIEEEGVTHLCGAPVVLNTIANAAGAPERMPRPLRAMTAGASPPAAVIARMEAMGIEVTHVYGLTETYGPAVVNEWKAGWDDLAVPERARLKARQGVPYMALADLMVADPETREPVPADGETMGEVFMRGNLVMKGYLKAAEATEGAFRGGWFATGDLGVRHPDGYVELKDRSKDIIITGGENVSSVEVEGALYDHEAVLDAAVVAAPDERWGETPWAFVELKPGAEASEEELIAHCREVLAHFKAPRRVVFGPLPRTSTGKVQKFALRERARETVAER